MLKELVTAISVPPHNTAPSASVVTSCWNQACLYKHKYDWYLIIISIGIGASLHMTLTGILFMSLFEFENNCMYHWISGYNVTISLLRKKKTSQFGIMDWGSHTIPGRLKLWWHRVFWTLGLFSRKWQRGCHVHSYTIWVIKENLWQWGQHIFTSSRSTQYYQNWLILNSRICKCQPMIHSGIQKAAWGHVKQTKQTSFKFLQKLKTAFKNSKITSKWSKLFDACFLSFI